MSCACISKPFPPALIHTKSSLCNRKIHSVKRPTTLQNHFPFRAFTQIFTMSTAKPLGVACTGSLATASIPPLDGDDAGTVACFQTDWRTMCDAMSIRIHSSASERCRKRGGNGALLAVSSWHQAVPKHRSPRWYYCDAGLGK